MRLNYFHRHLSHIRLSQGCLIGASLVVQGAKIHLAAQGQDIPEHFQVWTGGGKRASKARKGARKEQPRENKVRRREMETEQELTWARLE